MCEFLSRGCDFNAEENNNEENYFYLRSSIWYRLLSPTDFFLDDSANVVNIHQDSIWSTWTSHDDGGVQFQDYVLFYSLAEGGYLMKIMELIQFIIFFMVCGIQ